MTTTTILRLTKNYFSHYSGLTNSAWNGIFLIFAETIFVGVYYFLPVYFVTELNFNIVTASTLISFYGFGTILGGYFGGRLSDNYTPATICSFSLALQAIIFLLLLKLKITYLLSADLFLMGFFSYSFITSCHLYVLEHCGSEDVRLKALNILNVASNLGLAISAILIGFLAQHGFRDIFLFGSICLLLLALYFLISLNNKKTIIVSKLQNTLQTTTEVKTGFKKNPNKILYLALTCTFLMGLIIFQSNTTYSIYLRDTFPALGFKSLSILFTLNSLMVVFLQTPIVNIFGNDNKISVMGWGTFLLGFGMLALTFSNSFYMAVLSCIIYTVGEMLFFSISQSICYEGGENEKKGKTMGLYRTVYASSRIAAPVLGGIIFQHLGANMLWYLCGLIGLVCLLQCNYYKKLIIKI